MSDKPLVRKGEASVTYSDESRITVTIDLVEGASDTTAADLVTDAFRSLAGALNAAGYLEVDRTMEDWVRARAEGAVPF
jgi:hypothetical protein